MLDVISSAKNTQWFSFPDFRTNSTYSHAGDEEVDFQTLPGRNSFVEFNKKSGFELLRTVNKNNLNAIQRMKKRQIEDLSCGAVSKLYGDELAIGLSTGFVKIFSITQGEFSPKKFKPDKVGNTVIGLDYSNDDEYLAAIYESNEIALFGKKTGVRTNSFSLVGASLIRFHPVKKFTLAIASYQGAIIMLDVQTKKKTFCEKTAHSAPARDISMLSSSPDIFVSCGFDSNINVYDLRKRTIVQQYPQSHPMSTISVSSCGTFCVGGNLKGDVISFDFRNMKEPIDTKRAHDSAVVRVAFVPSASGETNTTLTDNANALAMDFATPLVTRPAPAQCGMESFMKFVDVCQNKDSVKSNDATPSVNDSWADMMPAKRNHNFSDLSITDTPSSGSGSRFGRHVHRQNAIDSSGNSVERESLSPCSAKSSIVSSRVSKDGVSPVMPEPRPTLGWMETPKIPDSLAPNALSEWFAKELSDGKTSTPAVPILNNRADRAGTVKKVKELLQHISEEDTEFEAQDKENRQNNHQNDVQEVSGKDALASVLADEDNGLLDENEMILVKVKDINDVFSELLEEHHAKLAVEVKRWQDQILAHFDEKCRQAENMARSNRSFFFHRDFTHRFESFEKQRKNLLKYEEMLAALLRIEKSEEKLAEYRAEVIELRRKLDERRDSH